MSVFRQLIVCVALCLGSVVQGNNADIVTVPFSTAETDGFKASILITGDEDWQGELSKPRDEIVRFSLMRRVLPGQNGTLLISFSNPSLEGGKVNISCNILVLENGVEEVNLEGQPCASFVPQGSLSDVYHSPVTLTLVADEDDNGHVLEAFIEVIDLPTGRVVPLEASVLMGE